jgi:hypothetical protein
VTQNRPQARGWVDELSSLSARTGMRELHVRAHLHRARLGQASSLAAARVLAQDIDNPVLRAQVEAG